MSNVPAGAGWRWVINGFVLFRKRPWQLSLLFTSYMFAMLALGIVPVIGQLLPLFLAPTFSMVFMTVCAQIKQNGEFNPLQLRLAFASPVARRLAILGVVYLIAAVLAVAVSFMIDGGLFMKLMLGQRDMEASAGQRASVLGTIVVLAIIYVPFFWYAAPLIVWQKMTIGKSIFYSFFTVFRNFTAFIVYFLSWLAIGALLPALLSGVLVMLIGKTLIAMVFMFLLTIVLTVIMYCSFYSTYVDIYGEPELPQVPDNIPVQ